MSNTEYKYDVAFSFLQEDENLAIEINNLLKDRVSTFIYTEEQKQVAGKDGETEFSRVFGAEARIVVVFYRERWGTTSWTRIEETAIRNRAYDHGYDFVLFIPLDTAPQVPKWLPRNRLWIGLERWGVEGAANVIEARVQEAGGEPKVETLADRAKRISEEVNFQKYKKAFLESEAGVKAATEEATCFINELQKAVAIVTENTELHFEQYKEGVPESRNYALYFYACGLTVSNCMYHRYGNTLEKSGLYITVWPCKFGFPTVFNFDKPQSLTECMLSFDLLFPNRHVWRNTNDPQRVYSSKQLAEFSVKLFLHYFQRKENGEFKEGL
ncbi:MAG: hypothetical protein LLF76_07125 [Planctomycetaceae bacterium]|nr:hypothetical protein [Planctomycetaceae bacterium]